MTSKKKETVNEKSIEHIQEVKIPEDEIETKKSKSELKIYIDKKLKDSSSYVK